MYLASGTTVRNFGVIFDQIMTLVEEEEEEDDKGMSRHVDAFFLS